MRLLNAAALTALVALVAFGCYNPALDNCQFACGADNACPANTVCMGGFCGDPTVGTCGSDRGSGDAGTPPDAGSGGSGSGVCPPTSPCGATPIAVAADDCAVLCTQQVTFGSALDTCGSDTGAVQSWHIAILDSPAKRAAFGTHLPTSVAWIGLQRTVTTWSWLNATNEAQPTTTPPWASGEPSANPANNEGTFDSLNGSDVFRTGTLSDKKQFFCEYRPN